jgi:radical SAM superfamily enzyme YgiQ (UPF0313 family)
MKVLLVNPPRLNGVPVVREERCEITERTSVLPPYSLLQIASILMQKGCQVSLIDANGLNISYRELNNRLRTMNYDVLIFRFTPTTFDADTRTAVFSKILHPKATTVGICWTLRTMPESVLQNCESQDIYILHEYEAVVPALVSALSQQKDLTTVHGIAFRKGDKITVTASAEPLPTWDKLPLPAYDLLPSLKNYYINTQHGSPFTIIYASKGCPYSCIYCTERNTKLKNRSAQNILKELRYLKGKFHLKTVSFFDETFTLDRERAIAISTGIKQEKLKITWYCNTRVNLVDKELLRTMYDGGCRGISFGIESGSQQILDNAKKGVTVQQAAEAIKMTKKSGLKPYCSFVIGLPGENWSTIKETIAFVKKTLPTGAQFNVAVPYPGTELYNIALEKGWIEGKLNWRYMYQHAATMRTDDLLPADLEKARKMAYRSVYFNSKWILQNIWHTFKHPEDFYLATGYVAKIANNYLLHHMEHAH